MDDSSSTFNRNCFAIAGFAHYLELLAGAGMVGGLQKFAGEAVRQRGSSPKLQVFNTALMTAQSGYTFKAAQADPEYWGHLVESAVGAHLGNAAAAGVCELFYWRDRGMEVDFIVRAGRVLIAMEVKSGRAQDARSGLTAFVDALKPQRKLLIGGDGIALKAFLSRPAEYWIGPRSTCVGRNHVRVFWISHASRDAAFIHAGTNSTVRMRKTLWTAGS